MIRRTSITSKDLNRPLAGYSTSLLVRTSCRSQSTMRLRDAGRTRQAQVARKPDMQLWSAVEPSVIRSFRPVRRVTAPTCGDLRRPAATTLSAEPEPVEVLQEQPRGCRSVARDAVERPRDAPAGGRRHQRWRSVGAGGPETGRTVRPSGHGTAPFEDNARRALRLRNDEVAGPEHPDRGPSPGTSWST